MIFERPIPDNCGLFFTGRFDSMAAMKPRRSKIKRHTLETKISIQPNLDGKGESAINTGIPFFDHMLTLFAKHAIVDLQLRCDGDLAVDAHHTVEDCGIALGQAFAVALGDKRGIRRYGDGFHPKNPVHRRSLCADGRMPRALRRGFRRTAAPRLARAGQIFAEENLRARKKIRTLPARSGSGWRVNFSRPSPTKPAATCIWSCFTATSRTTSWRRCSRRLPARWTPRAGTTRASPASCRAPRGT